MEQLRIGFIGLGLIGGSIAKAVRKFYPDSEMLAYDTNRTTLSAALKDGTMDLACTSIDSQFAGCRYIFLCAPVASNSSCLSALKPYLSKDTVLTDVGSVKTGIHREIAAAGMEANFIGGHPMAGSEKSGYGNSNDHLIENAYYVLTPTASVSPEKVAAYSELVQSLGAIPLILDHQDHDYITAVISHLPHIIASSLVNLVRDSDSAEGTMKAIAAGGFRDITRIASSSPVMWQQICLENRENILKTLDDYIRTLETAREEISRSDEDSLYQLFDTARDYRNSMPESSLGPIKKAYAVYCDIIDEAGGIATIATILASNHISIKNIGIIHNREFEEGVLRIEFYEEEASRLAAELLRKYHYTVYER